MIKSTLLLKASILLVVLFAMTLLSSGQDEGCQIWLRNGATAAGQSLEYQTPILKPAVFSLDGTIYQAIDVAFFRNQRGYVGSLGDLYGYKSERYALRILEGKMDIYEEIDVLLYTSAELPDPQTVHDDPLMATGADYQFYTLDKTSLKKFSYGNLRMDLADNEKSMSELKRFNKLRWLQRLMITAALGVITYDIASQDAETLTLTPVTAFGFVLGGSSFFLERSKHDSLMDAADAFNEH